MAYIPRGVAGHAILPVLACEEIAMSRDAVLSAGNLPAQDVADPVVRQAYTSLAQRRLTIPPAVALGVLDASLAVYRVETNTGVQFVSQEGLQKLQQDQVVNAVVTIKKAGEPLRLTGDALRHDLRLVSNLVEDRKELATALKLAPADLMNDPSLGDGWRAAEVKLEGVISAKNVNQALESIRESLKRGQTNLIFLRINSPGGSVEQSQQLAATLSELDNTKVRTVAVVEGEARADAALPVLACDELYMTPGSILGGPGEAVIASEQLETLRQSLRPIAQAKGRDWTMLVAVVDRDLSVYQFRRQTGTAQRLLCDEEHQALPNADDWVRGELVSTRNGLDTDRSVELGLAQEASAFPEVTRQFNVENDVTRLEPNWITSRLECLASQPWFARTLLFVAFFALISEASAPGLGLPGFVSACCFLLFFWAQFLNGTSGWLEVLLFLAGIMFVGLEIVALPGFGVFGIGGLIMIVSSIVLASQTFVVPHNSYQWQKQTSSLMSAVIGLSGVVAGLFLMRRYLPHTPWLRRLLLAPPDEQERLALETREQLADYRFLLHKRGVAATRLAPSGKARFGDEVLSVRSEGEWIASGEPIQVIDVVGNRIVVRHCP